MKAMLKTFVAVASLILLASCAASRGTTDATGTEAATEAATPPSGAQGAYQGYDARGATGTYGYDKSGGVTGQGGGGPNASASGRVVYFDYDSAEVRADGRTIVEANARYLVANPSAATVLEGHSDERGSREYNIGLGERRAEAVRRQMAALGVASQQMRTVSYGEERAAVAGHDEASYAQNRRVEITY